MPKVIRLSVLGILCCAITATHQLSAQLVYTESFRHETASGWEFSQGNTSPGPRLTAAATPVAADPEFGAPALDNNGNGWLRLATTTGEQSNAVALDTSFAAQGATITIAFDFAFWKPGTDPADGITAFFWDASEPFSPGGFGGSLGYANRTSIDGLAGGYVGAGLDVFGNYSNPTENRNGGTGMRPGEVAVRGPGSGQTGYEFLAGTGSNGIDSLTDTFGAGFSMDFINSPKRPDQDAVDYRRFEMTLDAANNLTVRMQDGYYGTMTDLFTVAVPGIRPDQLRFGFAGSTGGSVEVYEIRNLEVRVDGGTNAYYWDNEAGNTLWNTGLNWDQNTVPANHSHVYFTDQFPDTQTPQTVNVNIAPILNSMTFNGTTPYTLTGSNTITFDTDGNGPSYLNILNSPYGNANHSIAANLAANNALQIQNLVAQTLSLSGNIAGGSHPLTIVTGAGGQTTASGTISGSGTITTKGVGTTTFSGNNTYTGTTTVEQGTLRIEHANALGTTGSGTTVQSGATLALAGGNTFAAEPLTLSGSGTHGQGALYNAADNNTWTGTTTLAANAAIGAASNTQLTLTGNLNGAGNTLTFLPRQDGHILIGSNTSLPGSPIAVISGAGTNVVYAGQGTTELGYNSVHTYTGTTTIRSGTVLSNSSVGAYSESAFGNSATPIQMGDSGTAATDNIALLFNTATWLGSPTWTQQVVDREININNHGDTVTLGATGGAELILRNSINLSRDLTIFADTDTTVRVNNVGAGNNGTLTGTGDLIMTGTGTLNLNGNNTRTGNLFIQEGTVLVSNATNALDSTGRVTLANNATALLNIASNETIGSLAGGGSTGGNVNIASGITLTTGGDNTSTTFSGSLTGPGNLTKAGTGTMTFDGTNTLSGTLTAASGTVALGANNVFANNMTLALNGGTVATNGYSDVMGTLNRAGAGTLDFSGIPGSTLSFSSTTGTGALTVDNWIGQISGGGASQFLVTSAGAPGNLGTISFLGWGTGAQLVGSSGNYEIVPSLQNAYIWTGAVAANNNWASGTNNWIQNNVASSPPDSTAGTRVYFGAQGNNNLNVNLTGGRTVGVMILDRDDGQGYNFTSNNTTARTLTFSQTGGAFLTVSGDASHHISASASNRVNITSPNSVDMTIINNSSHAQGLIHGVDSGTRSTFGIGSNSTIRFLGTGNTTLNSIVQGGNSSSQLVFDGPGNVRLTQNNTFTGSSILNDGTLQIGHDNALGNSSNTYTINGGNLEAFGAARTLANDFTIAGDHGIVGTHNLTQSGTVTLAAGTHRVTVAEGLTHTYSGNLTESGGLIKDGPGTTLITGNTRNNSFSGGLSIDGGTLSVGTSGTRINSTMRFGNSQNNNTFLGTGDITVNPGGNLEIWRSGTGNMEFRNGVTLANHGGTILLDSNNAGATLNIGQNGSNSPAHFTQSSGTSTFNLAGSTNLNRNASINVSGGDMTFNLGGNFSTENNSGNPASLNVTDTGSLNLNITGTSNITLGQHDTLNITGSNANATFTGQSNSTINLNGTTTLASGGTLTTQNGTTTLGATAQLNGGSAPNKGTLVIQNGDLTVNNAATIVNAPNLTFNASGSQTLNGAAPDTSLENLGTVTITGGGTVALGTNLNNLQAQRIHITGGTLLNSDSDQIENFTPMTLANGTWNTGGHSEVLGTLTLSADSTINLGSGASVINFANSASETWSADQTLYVTNWSGNTAGGGTDQLIFGSSASALSGSQIDQIRFVNPAGFAPGTYGAKMLASGEVVPFQPIPEPSTYALGGLLTLFLAYREWKRRKPCGGKGTK